MKRYKIVLFGMVISLFSFAANATEIYNKDGTIMKIGGRIMYIFENSTQDDIKATSYPYGRFNVYSSKKVNEDVTAFGKLEWGVHLDSYDYSQALKIRYGFLGAETKYGTFSFGRQNSTYKDVVIWTDEFAYNGGEGLLAAFDGVDGSFLGTGRSDSSILYARDLGKVQVSLQTMFNGKFPSTPSAKPQLYNGIADSAKNVERDWNVGGSVRVTVLEGLQLGLSSVYTAIDVKSTALLNGVAVGDLSSSDTDFMTVLGGFRYDNKYVIASVLGGWFQNGALFDSKSVGQESFFAVKYDELESYVFVGNNYTEVNQNGDKYTRLNYASVGFYHFFIPDFHFMGEYRYDLRSALVREKAKAAGGSETLAHGIFFAFRYNL